jgi:hypothetical protein
MRPLLLVPNTYRPLWSDPPEARMAAATMIPATMMATATMLDWPFFHGCRPSDRFSNEKIGSRPELKARASPNNPPPHALGARSSNTQRAKPWDLP